MKYFKSTYARITLITFIIATILMIVAYNIVSWIYNKDLNLAVESIEFIASLIVIVQLLFMLREYKQSSQLILIFMQAYICFALGELFWILHIYIKQFEQLGTFSISDLSWVGFFAFFLTAYRDIFKKKPQLKKKSVFSVLLTVLVPITLTAGFLFLFMTGDGIVYTIIYLALSILLGYYSVRQILLKDSFKLIHIYILALIYLDLIVSISINLNSEFSHMLKLVFSICLISVNTIFSICIQKQLQAEKDDEEAEVSEMVGVV